MEYQCKCEESMLDDDGAFCDWCRERERVYLVKSHLVSALRSLDTDRDDVEWMPEVVALFKGVPLIVFWALDDSPASMPGDHHEWHPKLRRVRNDADNGHGHMLFDVMAQGNDISGAYRALTGAQEDG
jgi:hypothetical protein